MNILTLTVVFLVIDLYLQSSKNEHYQVQARELVSWESFGGPYENGLDIETRELNTLYDSSMQPKPLKFKETKGYQYKKARKRSKKRKWRKKTFRNCHRNYCSQFGSVERKMKPFDIVVHIKK